MTSEQIIHPQMLISLNYSISIACFISFYLLKRKGEFYNNCSLFMLFMGISALFGGFVHHMQKDYLVFSNFFNQSIPNFLLIHNDTNPAKELIIRLWFITVICIGFTEYYFMALFIYPVIKNKYQILKTYLKFMLLAFSFAVILVPNYTFVVVFHILSHIIIILISLVLLVKYKVKECLILIVLLIYNIAAGIIQQGMKSGLIPSGSLNYNDWYHFLIILFVLFLHCLFYYTKILNNLSKVEI